MKGIVWDGSDVVATELAEPQARPGWSLVDVAYVGICGTDLHLVQGHHPRGQRGVVLGHEFVGRVHGRPVFVDPAVTDEDCRFCASDTRHLCSNLAVIGIDIPGALAPQVQVPDTNLIPLPADLPLKDAVVVEPLAVAVRAMRRASIQPGATAHVVGYGPIGCFVAQLCRVSGASRVTISESSEARAAVARQHGFEIISEPTRSAGYVIDCVGNASAARELTYWAAPHGVVAIVGVAPGHVPVDLQDAVLRELRFVGSRSYSREDITAALALLERGSITADMIVTRVTDLDGVPAAFDALSRGEEVKVLVRVGDE